MKLIKNKSDYQWWATEEYIEELDRIDNAHKGKWLKKLKALIMGKSDEPSKPAK